MMLKYKNKYKVYLGRYELPKPAKHINGIDRVHISNLKAMMIDEVSYLYGNVDGFIQFYPKSNRYFEADKVTEFVNSLELPTIPEYERCIGDYGVEYSGYYMTFDTFIHILPHYVYFVEQVKPYYKENYIEPKTFRQYMGYEQ